MEARIRIHADTRDEVEAALDELRAQFAERLQVVQEPRYGNNGEWSGVARLDGRPDWVGYSQHQRTLESEQHNPDQAIRDLDNRLGQEMNAGDYTMEYGFDVVGAIMGDAGIVYAESERRAELQIWKHSGTVSVWQDGSGWSISYPTPTRIARINVDAGTLVRSLYQILQTLISDD